MKLIVHEYGDWSVGIRDAYYSVECPFEREDVEPESLETFRSMILTVYAEFAEMGLSADYDFENIDTDEPF